LGVLSLFRISLVPRETRYPREDIRSTGDGCVPDENCATCGLKAARAALRVDFERPQRGYDRWKGRRLV